MERDIVLFEWKMFCLFFPIYIASIYVTDMELDFDLGLMTDMDWTMAAAVRRKRVKHVQRTFYEHCYPIKK